MPERAAPYNRGKQQRPQPNKQVAVVVPDGAGAIQISCGVGGDVPVHSPRQGISEL